MDFKRLNTNHKNGWEDFDICPEDVKYKADKLERWIMAQYKTPEFLRKYNKEYYHTVRKFKDGSMGYIGMVNRNKAIAERKTAKNLQKVKIALGTCQYYQWKPTLKKLIELTELSEPTVMKYKKILMPKK